MTGAVGIIRHALIYVALWLRARWLIRLVMPIVDLELAMYFIGRFEHADNFDLVYERCPDHVLDEVRDNVVRRIRDQDSRRAHLVQLFRARNQRPPSPRAWPALVRSKQLVQC